jgi:phosphoserine aminotransferase
MAFRKKTMSNISLNRHGGLHRDQKKNEPKTKTLCQSALRETFFFLKNKINNKNRSQLTKNSVLSSVETSYTR